MSLNHNSLSSAGSRFVNNLHGDIFLNSDNVLKSGVRKIVITVITQVLILVISVVTGFIMPQLMGPQQFGYWQIYIFYFAYLNIFGLGFNDGIALFYGGYDYKGLPFDRLRSAMRYFYIYLAAITCVLFLSFSFISDPIYHNIFIMLALNIPLTCVQCIVLTVFLAVNRTGIYNIVSLLTKLIAVVFYLVLIFAGVTNYLPLIYADLASKIIITVICIILGREFLFGKVKSLKPGLTELGEKSKSGINITLAIIASMFIPVAGRVIIEIADRNKLEYGLYSFAMTLLTIIIAFTNTAGLVVFPLIKRLPEEKLSEYYPRFSFICDSLIYLGLILYIPLWFIIGHWMQKYITVLVYMHVLLVMCLPLGRMQLLITPYYKAFRRERAFFITNGIGVAAMLLFTGLAYLIFHSLLSVAAASTIVLTVWTIFTELYLLKNTACPFDNKKLIVQLVMMAGFVIAASFQNVLFFTVIYGAMLVFYFVFNRKETSEMLLRFKKRNAI